MSRIQRIALAVCIASIAAATLLTLAGCGGGGDYEPDTTHQPVNCSIPGACT